MSKNVVFIPNIDLGDGRNKCYKYSIDSWSHFALSFYDLIQQTLHRLKLNKKEENNARARKHV